MRIGRFGEVHALSLPGRNANRNLAAPVALIVMMVGGAPAHPAGFEGRTACQAPAYREFDFWLGDWDVFEWNQPERKVAHALIEPILDRCVLHEIYEAADGHRGESFSIYDASRAVWHQTWVTSGGQLLTVEGGLQAEGMVLEGAEVIDEHTARQIRGAWRRSQGGVREVAVRSTDGGKTWAPWFDLLFRPHQRRTMR